MTDDLVEPYLVEGVFVDGWAERELRDGIYSSVGYRLIRGEKVVVVRILQRESTVRAAVRETGAVLTDPQSDNKSDPTKSFVIAECPGMVS